jgi:hypothetical protein
MAPDLSPHLHIRDLLVLVQKTVQVPLAGKVLEASERE